MAKGYRPVLRDQPFLMPVDMREWLPPDHLVWFVLEVVEQLDTSAFHRRAKKLKAVSGRAAFDPDLLAGLLLYAYCRGVRSSRQIERLCEVDVAFRIACAGDVPDHSVIARFRQNHDKAFAALFVQVLRLAAKAGLGRFGTIAIDGTKIAANASVDANRTEAWLREQVETILAEAAPGRCGRGRRARRPARGRAARRPRRSRRPGGEDPGRAGRDRGRTRRRRGRPRPGHRRAGGPGRGPARRAAARHPASVEVAALRRRLDRLIAAQQAKLDAHAARLAAAARAAGERVPPRPRALPGRRAQRHRDRPREAGRGRGPGRDGSAGGSERTADDKPARANLTDPGSRLMPTRRGWVQGYNVQVAVTDDQLIVATSVGQQTGDTQQFVPMMAAAEAAAEHCRQATGCTDITINIALADAGYASEANLTAPGPDRLIAIGKGARQHNDAQRRPTEGDPPPGASPREAMAHRLRTADGAARYKRRGATVEPAIGNLKKIITRFSGRGLQAAAAEIDLAAAAFNLLKIHRAGLATA